MIPEGNGTYLKIILYNPRQAGLMVFFPAHACGRNGDNLAYSGACSLTWAAPFCALGAGLMLLEKDHQSYLPLA